MRSLKVCKNCQHFVDTKVFKEYSCTQIMDGGLRVDVWEHTKEQFEDLPLYKGCPYYMEHIVMEQEAEC